jgi:hypothetical protein
MAAERSIDDLVFIFRERAAIIEFDGNRSREKVLVCHCYPLRCHGNTLAGKANEANK